ncbi:MAG: thioredoxin domain-containing protein [Flavobacteriales bacterium]|nr:thioredoxin domain-containing protein [Flavobacteriales bacterium]
MRYSTDVLWKVPHFEKMLYDNAQLVSLYSQAYQAFGKPLYKQTVEQALAFIQRENDPPNGLFYSALDADTEGEEGALLRVGKGRIATAAWCRIRPRRRLLQRGSERALGTWPCILLRQEQDQAFAEQFGIALRSWNNASRPSTTRCSTHAKPENDPAGG